MEAVLETPFTTCTATLTHTAALMQQGLCRTRGGKTRDGANAYAIVKSRWRWFVSVWSVELYTAIVEWRGQVDASGEYAVLREL